MIDANEIERMARERPDECFLKGSGILKLTGAIRDLESQVKQLSVPAGVNGWRSRKDGLPPEGMYLVYSSYGVHCAYRHDPKWTDCFQDDGSKCDEGMQDDYGRLFEVYAWMPLPAAPANKEG